MCLQDSRYSNMMYVILLSMSLNILKIKTDDIELKKKPQHNRTKRKAGFMTAHLLCPRIILLHLSWLAKCSVHNKSDFLILTFYIILLSLRSLPETQSMCSLNHFALKHLSSCFHVSFPCLQNSITIFSCT